MHEKQGLHLLGQKARRNCILSFQIFLLFFWFFALKMGIILMLFSENKLHYDKEKKTKILLPKVKFMSNGPLIVDN